MKNEANNPRRRGRKNRSVVILGCVAAALVILIIAMLLMIPRNVPQNVETTGAAETTAPEATSAAATEADASASTEETAQTTEPTEAPREMLPEMAELYEQNPDTVGYIEIAGTKLSYPVMFTPEDQNKYFRKSFDGKFSIAGVPYIKVGCSLDPASDNIIIYGHNMYDGTAFNTMLKYDQKTFWEKHPTFTFNTLYEEKTYEIISCFYDRIYAKDEDVFKFYQFINAEDEEDFNEAIRQYKKKALYDIEATAEYGDKLVTLITCSYHVTDGRFVIVGREMTPEEVAAMEQS